MLVDIWIVAHSSFHYSSRIQTARPLVRGWICRVATIGPVLLLSLLGVTFCLGLKRHQNSRRDTPQIEGTIVDRDSRSHVSADSDRRSSVGSGDTADAASKLEEPRRKMRCLIYLDFFRRRPPVIPEEMLEQGDKSNVEQVRVGLNRADGVWGRQRVCVCVGASPDL